MGCHDEYGMCSGIHIIMAGVRTRIGAIINVDTDDSGCSGSLMSSLKLSVIGCKRPVMFDPL